MLTRTQRLRHAAMERIVPKAEALQRKWEDSVAARPGAVHAGPSSPERVNIIGRAVEVPEMVSPPGFPRSGPQMAGSMRGIHASVAELDDNPAEPRTTIDPEGIQALESFAKSIGALSIGYAEVDHNWIFKDKAVMYDNAIVLVQEMDPERINTAPSPAAGQAVHETYNSLGQVSNQVARYLRRRGYATHAGHPLNGMALYPPLAQAAGLGWRGIHGLIITPEMGPVVRLAAVFTSIENLPFAESNEHGWIEEFCDHCRLCVRKCPVDAIYTEPIRHESGRITCADDDKCLPYFAVNHGCSICVAVCPFNKLGYDRLHEQVLAHGHEEAVEKVLA